jgi:hypothetical protein
MEDGEIGRAPGTRLRHEVEYGRIPVGGAFVVRGTPSTGMVLLLAAAVAVAHLSTDWASMTISAVPAALSGTAAAGQ